MEAESKYRELLSKLSPKEQHFVSEYLIHKNATKAAREAGYSASSPHVSQQIGYELLSKLDVAACVSAGLVMIAERCEVTAERVVRELAAIGFSNLLHYRIDNEGYVEIEDGAPAEAMQAIASVERDKAVKVTLEGDTITTYKTKYRLWDKVQALTLLGKKLKLWVDKVEVDNPQDELYRELLRGLKEKK